MELSAALIGAKVWTLNRNETGVTTVEIVSITKETTEGRESIVFGISETDANGCSFDGEAMLGDLFLSAAEAETHFADEIEQGKARWLAEQARRRQANETRLKRLRQELAAIQAEIKQLEDKQ